MKLDSFIAKIVSIEETKVYKSEKTGKEYRSKKLHVEIEGKYPRKLNITIKVPAINFIGLVSDEDLLGTDIQVKSCYLGGYGQEKEGKVKHVNVIEVTEANLLLSPEKIAFYMQSPPSKK